MYQSPFPVLRCQVQSAGYHTALLLKENGKPALYTWGCNGTQDENSCLQISDDGVLGRVTEDEQEGDAAKVELENVVKIAVGGSNIGGST
jgi:hypothetical protein